ncbi:TetR/AcrR family transcriptional regulator [Thalassobacillus sp. CUG 92003]|uniref:TetR/AcrR family transcriptional regulator n=1 Tax=Thalassobacillus sp. CUG 92003 TaxID=2736641 RepID=UPI0015E6C76F|nr:TetR/AcrR family transcriptional regulator [Thalassobacillus sp. CUG 92003]
MAEHDHLQQLLEAGDEELKLTKKQVKILEAAIEMFAEKGYASTSTSEIAQKAGVAEGTIFRHYRTKKELLMAIVSPVISKFAMPFFATHFARQVFEGPPAQFEDLLKKLIYNRFEFVKENAPLLKILLQEVSFHPELQQHFQEVFAAKVLPKFEEAIQTYQQNDQIIQYPSPTIMRMIMTTIIGFLITRFLIMPDHEWDDQAEIDRTVHFILHGLGEQNT